MKPKNEITSRRNVPQVNEGPHLKTSYEGGEVNLQIPVAGNFDL
jgi:hypothetical protein